jgi:FkbM family methyltransferase
MKRVLALVRRLATLPGIRRLTRFGPLLRVSFALRGALVSEPFRFAFNELQPGRRVATYALRRSGVRIALRHHTPDVLILDEIVSQEPYEPPEAAAVALERLGRPLRVLDLGANIGLFGAWALGRFPVASIHGVEPDPENAAVHALTIAENRGRAQWRLTRAFAAASEGELSFHAGAFTTSHAAATDESGFSVLAIDVLPLLADADLVKIDVEGAEWPIILDKRFAASPATAVVLEYHGGAADRAEAALRAPGYRVASTAREPRFGTGVIWAWREP